jgi:hypothetical protein
MSTLAFEALLVCCAGEIPLPNQRQLDFMELETIQFSKFNERWLWTTKKPSLALYKEMVPRYTKKLLEKRSARTAP